MGPIYAKIARVKKNTFARCLEQTAKRNRHGIFADCDSQKRAEVYG